MARSAVAALLAAAASLAVPCLAHADTLDTTVTTLIAGRQDPRDGKVYTVVPIYQSLTLIGEVDSRHVQDLKIVASGWGELAFGDPREGTGTGDLDLAFVEGGLFKRRVQLRIGRQMVFGGVARAIQLDGAQLSVRVWRGLSATLYGGAPVTPRFGVHRGDALVGTRVSYRLNVDSEFGVSFIHVLDQGRIGRQEIGADARYRPHRTLTLTGYAQLSTIEARIAEADVAATWQPLPMIEARFDWRRTAPDLWIPRSSIFSVFSQESHDEAGASIFVRPLPRLSVSGDYHAIVDTLSAVGHRGGGRAQLSLGAAFQTQVGAELRVLSLPERGYLRARLFGQHRFPHALSLTLDLDLMHLDRPINGQDLSFTAAATLGWDFYKGWRVVATAIEDVTPFVENRFEFMVKIAYNRVSHSRQVRK